MFLFFSSNSVKRKMASFALKIANGPIGFLAGYFAGEFLSNYLFGEFIPEENVMSLMKQTSGRMMIGASALLFDSLLLELVTRLPDEYFGDSFLFFFGFGLTSSHYRLFSYLVGNKSKTAKTWQTPVKEEREQGSFP